MRWPVQLAGLLRKNRGVQISNPEIVARTGWTASELSQGILQVALQPPYDLVSLQIGVNDRSAG